MQRLHDTAALGKSWACECLLLDDQGSDQGVIPILRGIHADVLLKTLRIVVITRSSELAARLHDEFSVYVLTGTYKSESLHRLLKRLFDVAGTVRNETTRDALLDHFDLNVDQESILVPDNIEPVTSGRTRGAGASGRRQPGQPGRRAARAHPPGHGLYGGGERAAGIGRAEGRQRFRHGADGLPDAGDGRLRGNQAVAGARAGRRRASADRGHDRQCHAG